MYPQFQVSCTCREVDHCLRVGVSEKRKRKKDVDTRGLPNQGRPPSYDARLPVQLALTPATANSFIKPVRERVFLVSASTTLRLESLESSIPMHTATAPVSTFQSEDPPHVSMIMALTRPAKHLVGAPSQRGNGGARQRTRVSTHTSFFFLTACFIGTQCGSCTSLCTRLTIILVCIDHISHSPASLSGRFRHHPRSPVRPDHVSSVSAHKGKNGRRWGRRMPSAKAPRLSALDPLDARSPTHDPQLGTGTTFLILRADRRSPGDLA